MGNGKEWKEGLGEWKSTPPLKLLSRVLFLWPLASGLGAGHLPCLLPKVDISLIPTLPSWDPRVPLNQPYPQGPRLQLLLL